MAMPTFETPTDHLAKGASIRLEYKHRLAIRWMHWINFPVLFLMVWSGLLIYWNDSDNAYLHPHRVYRIGVGHFTLFRFFPDWFYARLHVPYHVTQGLGYHFFFMWIFVLNGVVYVLYNWLSSSLEDAAGFGRGGARKFCFGRGTLALNCLI
jgi:thiosulfate reductase cytochrome b subunit